MLKNKDINVQKLEERLLNTGQKEYFKLNGEIKMSNDLLSDELTRPADLAFEQTTAFQTVENNSLLTDRLNSFKKRYYKINVLVGTLQLRQFSKLFTEEDQLVMELKAMCKAYDKRTSLALIPFYVEKLKQLDSQIREKSQQAETEREVREMKRLRKYIHNDKEKEVKEINAMAKEIYAKWLVVVNLRTKQEKPHTFTNLKVHKGAIQNDVLFTLEPQQVPEEHNPQAVQDCIA
mmetsp:Transcript_37280/g.57179  ORF Transcript_37280/g.57179 Transcript_37280/m.57179 type:complete len:234 (+) Transcript_37280:560-1261(+)